MIKVRNAFKKMDYEEALESNIETLEWIAEHNGQFGHFIGGRFTKPKNLFKTILAVKLKQQYVQSFINTNSHLELLINYLTEELKLMKSL